jgi:hypothetical protein
MATLSISMRHKISLQLSYISKEIFHNDPRNRDLSELYKQIETKGASQAWTEYIIEDLNELILDCGAEYVLQNLNQKARQLLTDYIQGNHDS